MPVGIQNAGKRSVPFAHWTVEIASEVKAWIRLEINLLHCITVALDFPEDLRAQGRLLWQRPQTTTHEDMFTDFACAPFPGALRLDVREGAQRVQGPGRLDASVNRRKRFRESTPYQKTQTGGGE